MMANERYTERKEKFLKALKRLEEIFHEPENPFTRDATIQRFEFTYELAWRALKHLLANKDIDVRNAKDTLQAALEQGWIQDADSWSELHHQRNLTVHTYDEKLAKNVYHFLKEKGAFLFRELANKLNNVD